MKPNLLFVQTTRFEINPQIEKFCEHFCDTHYVYLIRPGSEFRDDTPSGLRFLNHSLDSLPGFADVDTVISVADEPEAADRLKEHYPSSRIEAWDTEDELRLPELLVSLLRPTVVKGDFGTPTQGDFARAM